MREGRRGQRARVNIRSWKWFIQNICPLHCWDSPVRHSENGGCRMKSVILLYGSAQYFGCVTIGAVSNGAMLRQNSFLRKIQLALWSKWTHERYVFDINRRSTVTRLSPFAGRAMFRLSRIIYLFGRYQRELFECGEPRSFSAKGLDFLFLFHCIFAALNFDSISFPFSFKRAYPTAETWMDRRPSVLFGIYICVIHVSLQSSFGTRDTQSI